MITKSVAVDAAPGVLAFDAGGVQVHIGPRVVVTLRHIILNGAALGGFAGIVSNAGGTLNIEHCDIGGFVNYRISTSGAGSNLTLTDSAVHDTGIGIYVLPPSAAAANVAFAHCSIHDVTNVGLWVYASATATVADSEFSNVKYAIYASSNTSGKASVISVNRCMISGSSGGALNAVATNSGLATIYVSNSSINRNDNAISTGTGTSGVATVISYGSNALSNNTVAGAFTGTAPTN